MIRGALRTPRDVLRESQEVIIRKIPVRLNWTAGGPAPRPA
jgi:hypothetical protein